MAWLKHSQNVSYSKDTDLLAKLISELFLLLNLLFHEFWLALFIRVCVTEIQFDVVFNIFIFKNHDNLSFSSKFVKDIVKNIYT